MWVMTSPQPRKVSGSEREDLPGDSRPFGECPASAAVRAPNAFTKRNRASHEPAGDQKRASAPPPSSDALRRAGLPSPPEEEREKTGHPLGVLFGGRSCATGLVTALASAAISLCAIGCRSLPPLEPVDLHQDGWTVRTGEGVWRGNRSSPEISGEILIAHRTNGDEFVAYTKTPFAMVMAQQQADAWQIESPARHKRHTGRGKAPHSIIWLQLPEVAQGKEPGPGWTLKRESDSRWRLEHDSDGESVEVFLSK